MGLGLGLGLGLTKAGRAAGGSPPPPPPVGPTPTVESVDHQSFSFGVTAFPSTGYFNLYVFTDAGLTTLYDELDAFAGSPGDPGVALNYPGGFAPPPAYLAPETTYYAATKAADSGGVPTGDYSPAATVTTTAAP